MPSGSEMRGDDSVHLEESLGVPPGLEPPHPSLPLTRWLMGVLGAVVQVSILPMSHTGHDDALRGGVTTQLVGNDYPRTATPGGPQQLAEESHGR